MPKNTPQRLIDDRTAGSSAIISGGGSTRLPDHNLLPGLTAGDPHTQYLRADGVRALTGSLSVADGMTIDGVDLSAHAANPDAHHARLHAITSALDHTVTGNQYQIVGLTGVNTLGLLTPSAAPGANTVVRTNASQGVQLVDATVTANLYMDGVLDFGTNYIDEDATYLQFSGSKAVKFNQNIGSGNWTIYNTGGASFGGSVDIISGGDLTVIGSGAYAGVQVLMVDSSGGNVGVNRAPDPQFALDIAGPARAEYWIGPHALQIADAILIAHYDGRTPYATNFYGEPNGHMGQVATVSGGAIYRPGKFGKALQIGWLCTNRFLDPSCEYDAALSLWSKYASAGTLTATRSTEVGALYGAYTGKLVKSASGTGLFYQSVTLPAGTAAITCYVCKADKSAVTSGDCNLYFGVDQTTTYVAVGGGWYRLVYQGATAGAATQAGLRVAAGKTLYVDAFQAEELRTSPYCDGTLGAGHTWNGAAHASTSTRTAAALSYIIAPVAHDAPATLMGWFNLDGASSKDYHYLWYTYTAQSAYVNASRILVVGGIDCGALPSGWVHIALTHTGGGSVTAYVNGVSKGSANITRDAITSIVVGGQVGANQSNGLIDDFALIGRDLPGDEIRAIYESNAPVFAETSVYVFRATPKGLVWADDEGLWARDVTGNPVLGVYGGEAATKSWAGFNLAAGDIVFGRNAVGSSAIRWNRSAGTFGFYGAGNASPQVEIATDGVLYVGTAGAARVEMRATQLAGYDAGNQRQWWGSTTDGLFYAGGGNAAISRHGYMVESTPDEPSFAWPFSWGGIHAVGDVSTPGTGWRASIVFGEPALVYAPSAPRIRSWLFQFAGDLTAAPPVSGQYSVADYALTIQDEAANTWRVWHEGNLAPARLDAPAAFAGIVSAPTLRATGDSGGVAGIVSFTNVTNANQSSGTGTIKLTGTTNRNNSGFLKIWVAGTAMWIPYFANIS